jgi:hypothetical protein
MPTVTELFDDDDIDDDIISDSASLLPPLQKTQTHGNFATPINIAKHSIEVALMSLASNTIHQYAKEYATSVLDLHVKVQNRKKPLIGFDDADRVPRSSRLRFQLQATPTVRQSEAFQAVNSSCDEYITEVQQHLKVFTKQVMEMELTQAKKDKAIGFISSIVDFTKIFYLALDGTHLSIDRLFHYTRAYLIRVTKDNTLYTDFGLLEAEWKEALVSKTGYRLDPNPPCTQLPPVELTFPPILDALFILPSKEYNSAERSAKAQLDIVKVYEASRLESATVATFKTLESEPSVTPERLATLITNAVNQAWKSNESKAGATKVSNKTGKNSNRGALKPPPDGASLKQPSMSSASPHSMINPHFKKLINNKNKHQTNEAVVPLIQRHRSNKRTRHPPPTVDSAAAPNNATTSAQSQQKGTTTAAKKKWKQIHFTKDTKK